MLDFTPVRERRVTMYEFARHFTISELRSLTEESVSAMLGLLEGCTDAEVVHVPDDPDAKDTYAVNPGDADLAWTLGHVVVHACASAEEYAFVGAELARGVEYHGRSRVEVPWQIMTTVDQCRRKLRESQRMRLGTLDVWPDSPNLENGYQPWRATDWVNCNGIFTWGLAHDDDHRRQIQKIRAQHGAAAGVRA